MAAWQRVHRDQQDILGEGLLWSARTRALYWVDILAPALHRLSLVDARITHWPMPEPVGWIVERAAGGFIAGLQSGFAILHLDPLRITPLGDPEPHLPNNRMNDGKIDPDGSIWCGTMDMAEQADSGALYRFDPDLRWTCMDRGFRIPNGPAFSPCGAWLYLADSARRVIYRYARQSHGALRARMEFIRFQPEDGYPDGMTTDAQGGLWVAHWGGGRISRFSPEGTRLLSIELPAKQISNLCFAGEKLDRLFVSSAAMGLPASLYDGAVFEIAQKYKGVPSSLFAG